ncbi:DUF881 domain-containing protein [Rothia sp. ARF10]|nr:DUF881 domain-containing protein [Rothia sp. ARF10]
MSAKKKKNRGKARPGGPPRQGPVVGAPAPEAVGGQADDVVEPDAESAVPEDKVESVTADEREPVAAETAVEPGPATDATVEESEPVAGEPDEIAHSPVPEREAAPATAEVEPAYEPVSDTEEPHPTSEPVESASVDDLRPYPGTPGPADSSERAWRRLGLAARPRPTKANVLATLLAIGLGFAIAAQVRQTSIEGLEDLREDELIRILDTVDQDGTRLAEEIQTLRFSRDRLQSDTTSLTESRSAAQQRLDSLAILTGTAPARGPGIVLTIRDPEFGVTAPMLLDTLQELRDAGAEAVEINDVRIVANTYFTDGEGGIAISGKDVSAPYVITAIGDGSTLASAMEIPGGVTNTVRSVGGEASIETKDEVTVSALQSVSEPQYARPIPSPTKS